MVAGLNKAAKRVIQKPLALFSIQGGQANAHWHSLAGLASGVRFFVDLLGSLLAAQADYARSHVRTTDKPDGHFRRLNRGLPNACAGRTHQFLDSNALFAGLQAAQAQTWAPE